MHRSRRIKFEQPEHLSNVVTAIRKIISWLSNRANFMWKTWEENNKELQHIFSKEMLFSL